jgi:hypothetical protein
VLQLYELFHKNTIKFAELKKSTQSVDREVDNDVDFWEKAARVSGISAGLHKKEAQDLSITKISNGLLTAWALRVVARFHPGFRIETSYIYKFLTCVSCCANS